MAGNQGAGSPNRPERRRAERRTRGDRRDQVRWEPRKDERRKGHGRRVTDGLRQARD